MIICCMTFFIGFDFAAVLQCGVNQNYFIFYAFVHASCNSGVSACHVFLDFQAILLLHSSNHWLKEIHCLVKQKVARRILFYYNFFPLAG
jgi:hypothetical protein